MIKKLNPECVWKNFHALTQVPRPSGHLEKIQQFLLDFAAKAGVEAFKDPAGNIVMRKPATPGMENKPGVILQSHMDMVPQKAPHSDHDFVNHPIQPRIVDDWVYATDTTLGADNGLGVAAIMSVMEAKDLKHGPVEALLTADEETSMVGANALPEGELNGKIMLNLDTESMGEFCIGSAGGIDVTAEIEYKEVETDAEDKAVLITVSKLRGGHSGLEIGLGRANANKLMVRIVSDAIANLDARLASWHGGTMRNAIPFECKTVLTLPAENVEELKLMVKEYEDTFKTEYYGIEPEISVTAEDVETPKTEMPLEIQDNVVNAIYACHNGVLRYIPTIPEVVETSSNLAIIDIEEGKAKVKILARSASESQKDCIATMLESCFSMVGMKVTLSGSYGGWDPNPNSKIVEVMKNIYVKLFGEEPKIQVVHAGLECSVIMEKYPGLDVISFGPTIESPHTAKERTHIPSVEPFWRLLTKTLEEI